MFSFHYIVIGSFFGICFGVRTKVILFTRWHLEGIPKGYEKHPCTIPGKNYFSLEISGAYFKKLVSKMFFAAYTNFFFERFPDSIYLVLLATETSTLLLHACEECVVPHSEARAYCGRVDIGGCVVNQHMFPPMSSCHFPFIHHIEFACFRILV